MDYCLYKRKMKLTGQCAQGLTPWSTKICSHDFEPGPLHADCAALTALQHATMSRVCVCARVCVWRRLAGMAYPSSTYLLILKLDSDDSEGVAGSVVVDVDPAEALLARLDWYPFLTGVIVDHHGSPGLADTLFTAEQERTLSRPQPQGMDAGLVLF